MSYVVNHTPTKKDFASPNSIKWCPGCGDYAILSSLQSTLAKVSAKKEDTVIISGIGCSGRLPYYMNTFGFHTLHGRAPAIATGLKLARPELSIWVIIGDGDGLSIGSNHLFHLLRRNLNINVILINNQIYGLTKGQFSPTSQKGSITPTSPYGSLERPINPVLFALSAGAGFVARAVDIDKENLEPILEDAYHYKGTAFIEILQNCHIFNSGVFDAVRNKKTAKEHGVYMRHNSPLMFGSNLDKAVCADGYRLVVKEAINNRLPFDIINSDYTDSGLALLLSQMLEPLPLGIFKKTSETVFEEQFSPGNIEISVLQNKYNQQFFNERVE